MTSTSAPSAASAPPAPPAPPAIARAAVPLVIVLGVVLVLALLVGLGWAPLLDLDERVGRSLVVTDPSGVHLLRRLTAPGDLKPRLAVILLVSLLLLPGRRWRGIAVLVLGAGLIAVVTPALKQVVGRPRPTYDDALVIGGLSFPSGHASGIAALGTALVVVLAPVLAPVLGLAWRGALLAAVVAVVLLVGVTRILLGVHYLSDVVAGWALGVGWALLVAALVGRWRPPTQRRVQAGVEP